MQCTTIGWHDIVVREDDSNNLENNEEPKLNDVSLEQALDETQPILCLQIADNVDQEMDTDLQGHLNALDKGVVTDNSDDNDMSLFV